MKGYVYIIKSLKWDYYYVGSSIDPARRLKEHNSGNVISMKHRKPYSQVFLQEFGDINIAEKVETRIKRWKRKDFIKKIIQDGHIRTI